jgi:hypothetical protein
MKLAIAFLIAISAFAQNSITVRVVKNGVATEAVVSRGADAAAGIDIAEQWMATQQVCKPIAAVPAVLDDKGVVITPEVPADPGCTPKYANVAEVGKAFILGNIKQLSDTFVSSALKADEDEIKAKRAALEAKKKAMFERSEKEKP